MLQTPRSIKTPWSGEGGGGVFLIFKAWLEGAAAVPTCPRGGEEQISPSGQAAAAGVGHIWLGRCGGSARGSLAVVFPSPSLSPSRRCGSQVTRAAVGWEGGEARESCRILLWGWGGSSALGGSRQPPGQLEPGQAQRSAFFACGAELRGWKDHMVPSAPA